MPADPEVTYSLFDCCVKAVWTADPVLELDKGDRDPFTGEEVFYPVIYWSNGLITEGYVTEVEDEDPVIVPAHWKSGV